MIAALPWEALDALGRDVLGYLLSALWQSTLLLGAILLACRRLRQRSAALRHALVAGSLLLSPFLPALSRASSRAGVPCHEIVLATGQATAAAPAPDVSPALAPASDRPAGQPTSGGTAAPRTDAAPPATTSDAAGRELHPWALTFLAWMAIATLLLARLILEALRVYRLLGRSQPAKDPRLDAAVRSAMTALGLRRRARLVEAELPAPIAAGLLRPTIAVPKGFAGTLATGELDAVLLHELAHVKRADPLVLTLAACVRVPLFFQPLVWLATREVARLAEEATDDLVLDVTHEPLPYAKLLAGLAEKARDRALVAPVAGMGFTRPMLRQRIEHVLCYRPASARALPLALVAATALGALSSLALATSLPLVEPQDRTAAQERPATPQTPPLETLLAELDPAVSRARRLAALRGLRQSLGGAEIEGQRRLALVRLLSDDLKSTDLEVRNAATAALGAMPGRPGEQVLAEVLFDANAATSHRILAARLLAERMTPEELTQRTAALRRTGSTLESLALEHLVSRKSTAAEPVRRPVTLRLQKRIRRPAVLVGLRPEGLVIEAAEIDADTLEAIELAATPTKPPAGLVAGLRDGSELRVEAVATERSRGVLQTAWHRFEIQRSELAYLGRDHFGLGRAPWPSAELALLTTAAPTLQSRRGQVLAIDGAGIRFRDEATAEETVALADLAALCFASSGRPQEWERDSDGQLVEARLADGSRIRGFPLTLLEARLVLLSPSLGLVDLGLDTVVELGVVRRVLGRPGTLLVTDYGNTSVLEYDTEGRETWRLSDLFDPVDAEWTPRGTVLITEQGDNAVREYDRKGRVVWSLTEGLSRPVDADRLPNGNTLIVDPGNQRVIEVDPDQQIVWELGRADAGPGFKPYDADRLASGNTLVVDQAGNRVIEVTPARQIVWSAGEFRGVMDADRLPNGNTLITMRAPPQVIEVTPAKAVVLRLGGLKLPGDADRLPDGSTMVSENFGVTIYGNDGKVRRKLNAEWAMEANGN